MRVQDFNAPPPAEPPQTPQAAAPQPGPTPIAAARAPANVVPLKHPLGEAGARAEAELALLRARIEHLELVIETARGLMTANQEKLLRRLHDMPREVAALTLRLGQLNGATGADIPGWQGMGMAQGGQE